MVEMVSTDMSLWVDIREVDEDMMRQVKADGSMRLDDRLLWQFYVPMSDAYLHVRAWIMLVASTLLVYKAIFPPSIRKPLSPVD